MPDLARELDYLIRHLGQVVVVEGMEEALSPFQS